MWHGPSPLGSTGAGGAPPPHMPRRAPTVPPQGRSTDLLHNQSRATLPLVTNAPASVETASCDRAAAARLPCAQRVRRTDCAISAQSQNSPSRRRLLSPGCVPVLAKIFGWVAYVAGRYVLSFTGRHQLAGTRVGTLNNSNAEIAKMDGGVTLMVRTSATNLRPDQDLTLTSRARTQCNLSAAARTRVRP
jgi:hypothetical protein